MLGISYTAHLFPEELASFLRIKEATDWQQSIVGVTVERLGRHISKVRVMHRQGSGQMITLSASTDLQLRPEWRKVGWGGLEGETLKLPKEVSR